MKTVIRSFQVGVAGLALLLWCGSAAAQDIRFNFLPGTDFAKYKTYKWARVPKVQYPDQILDTQIMQAIDAQLATKGLTKSSGDEADLVVTYQAAVNQEKQWNSFSTGDNMWGYGRWGGWGGYGGGMFNTTTPRGTNNIGNFGVGNYQAAAQKQKLKGEAAKNLCSGKNPVKVTKNINKAMSRLI